MICAVSYLRGILALGVAGAKDKHSAYAFGRQQCHASASQLFAHGRPKVNHVLAALRRKAMTLDVLRRFLLQAFGGLKSFDLRGAPFRVWRVKNHECLFGQPLSCSFPPKRMFREWADNVTRSTRRAFELELQQCILLSAHVLKAYDFRTGAAEVRFACCKVGARLLPLLTCASCAAPALLSFDFRAGAEEVYFRHLCCAVVMWTLDCTEMYFACYT